MQKIMIDLDETICSPTYLEEVNKYMKTDYQYTDIDTYFVEDIIPPLEREKFLDYFYVIVFLFFPSHQSNNLFHYRFLR